MEISLQTKSKIIKTESYRQLNEWINPQIPLNIWINGETGLGKTVSAIDICKRKGMKVVRINISHSTDVYQLIGSMTLKNGDMIWNDGIIIKAMREGYGVILDELDHGNNRVLMELQSILEHEGYTIKETKEFVPPAAGFFIIATGNSKGDGEKSSDYIGASPLNKAFRDRFDVWLQFDYPSYHEVFKILKAHYPQLNDAAGKALALFYNKIIESTQSGVIYNAISIRRMIALAKTFILFNITDIERQQAKVTQILNTVLNIYDQDYRQALVNVWSVINVKDFIDEPKTIDETGDEIPF
jgi:midasin (ATPase involved in ribosome maturation)